VTAATRKAPGRVELRLADGPSAAGRLVDLVRREKACCGFFSFAVEIDAKGRPWSSKYLKTPSQCSTTSLPCTALDSPASPSVARRSKAIPSMR
jgi:hypothetical protein